MGKVSAHERNTIEALRVQAAGEKFDVATYDKAVDLMNNKFAHLF